MGALIFGFVEPDQAKQWVREYYQIIKSEECVPLGHTVNPNLAAVSGFSLHRDEAEAERRGLAGFRYFGYSLAHYVNFRRARADRHLPRRPVRRGIRFPAGQCGAWRHRHTGAGGGAPALL